MVVNLNRNSKSSRDRWLKLSLDGWAVTIALLLALLVKLGVLKTAAW